MRFIQLCMFVVLKDLNPYIKGDRPCMLDTRNYKCQGYNLTSITQNIPTSIERINLNHNQISAVRKRDLATLINLVDLYLEDNVIEIIEDGAFDSLESLRYCDLSNNVLRRLPENVFEKNINIKSISLRSNILVSIPKRTFRGHTFLSDIDLSLNQLTSITWNAFDDLPSLKNVMLHGNPYHCDCYIKYLYDWIRNVQFFIKPSAEAASCVDTGQLIQSLGDDFFEMCKNLGNDEKCDEAHTCRSLRTCSTGICKCSIGFYDDNGAIFGGDCREVFALSLVDVGLIVSGILSFIGVSSIVLYIKMRDLKRRSQKAKEMKRKRERLQKILSINSNETIGDTYQTFDEEEKYSSRLIPVSEFEQKMELYHKDSDMKFALEWEDIMEATGRFSFLDAINEGNKDKNRDMGYIPYDINRVKLEEESGSSDYINASFISGNHSTIDYIAAQSPLKGTLQQFWQALWDQDVGVIVDVTYEKEDEIYQCYWESKGSVSIFGSFTIDIVSSANMSNTLINYLKVTRRRRSKTVTHYKFTGWKSFSLDRCSTMVDFLLLVHSNETSELSPTSKIIISRTGSERTGVFIALDIIIGKLKEGNKSMLEQNIDIYSIVLRMRNERMKMIAEEEQYIFVYECVKYYLETTGKRPSKKTSKEIIDQNVYLEL